MADIEELIPHRSPFLFVDEIISATKDEIIGVKTFSDENSFLKGSFPSLGFIPGTILIESMAQCGGAGVKKLNIIPDALFGLVSISDAQFLGVAEYNKEIKYVIKNLKIGDKIIKQSGIAYVDDKPVLEATWMCVKMN